MRAFVEIRKVLLRENDLKEQIKEIREQLGEYDVQLNPNFAVAKFLRSADACGQHDDRSVIHSDEKLAISPIFVRVNPDKLRFVGPTDRFCRQLQNLG